MHRSAPALIALFTTLILVSLFNFLAHAAEPWTNGQAANVVIGQPDFTTGFPGVTTDTLNFPADVAIDVEHGKLYIADGVNNRVLRYTYPITANQPDAELVFGQPDFTSGASGTTKFTFSNPNGLAVDNTGRLWVADFANNRVLWFDAAYTITSNQPNANGVLGQPNFAGNVQATTQEGMAFPTSVVLDSTGTLYVSEFGNHRVLRFDSAAAKANGAPADGVLGQPNFTNSTVATTQSGLHGPRGVALHDGSLFVADGFNARVLRFDDASNKADGAPADGVLGQPDFTSNTVATTQSGMSPVARVETDIGGRLYVSDVDQNERILIFNDAVSLPDGAPADYVLGQPNFTSSGPGLAADRIDSDAFAGGLAIDNENNRLFFADTTNNRVLGFQPSTPLGIPHLAIAKSGPATAESNEPFTYTLTISNSGSLTATAVVVTDVLPAGAAYVNGGALVSGSVVSWTVGTLGIGQQAQVQFAVRATDTVTNSAYGLSFAEGQPVTATLPVVTEIDSFPDLDISKGGPGNAAFGAPFTYTLTISNGGYAPATSVVVTDALPAGAEYLGGGTLVSGSVVSWTVGTLPAQSQAQVQFSVRATEIITNSVYGASFAEGDPVAGAEAVVTVIEPWRNWLPAIFK